MSRRPRSLTQLQQRQQSLSEDRYRNVVFAHQTLVAPLVDSHPDASQFADPPAPFTPAPPPQPAPLPGPNGPNGTATAVTTTTTTTAPSSPPPANASSQLTSASTRPRAAPQVDGPSSSSPSSSSSSSSSTLVAPVPISTVVRASVLRSGSSSANPITLSPAFPLRIIPSTSASPVIATGTPVDHPPETPSPDRFSQRAPTTASTSGRKRSSGAQFTIGSPSAEASDDDSNTTGYLPIENYGLIGNMRTCALVGIDGSVDFMCWPDFDSPSVFCRLLDKDKGGYFTISPPSDKQYTTKQQYLPSSNILQTRYIHEDGVVDLIDFFPRPRDSYVVAKAGKQMPFREGVKVQDELKKWLVRRVECIRGKVDLGKWTPDTRFEGLKVHISPATGILYVEIFPAFNYALDEHATEILLPEHPPGCPDSKTVTFSSKNLKLQLDVTIDHGEEDSASCPAVTFHKETKPGMLGAGVLAHIHLVEGQAISFVLRDDIPNHVTRDVTTEVLDLQQHDTQTFWFNWISKSSYKGRWREVVSRSLLILKLLTFEPTGAIIASPTFSIPEDIGGTRNWDYRFCWVRDSSFTIYILLRMGFTEEADAYMEFISERFRKSRSPDGALPIMFTIRGETEIPEVEFDHLSGYRDSKPVRIGNGAAFHQQFDIYGELLDGIYLYNKYGKPVTWEQWVAVREILDYCLTIWKDPDMSIWEVRSRKQNYTYSKVMLWVAFDRGLRLAEKRCLPCPNRNKWMETRDEIYEEIMNRGYSPNIRCFVQSYESGDHLDSSILIAPLVFFISPNDPRFLRTMDRILQSPEKGGLTSTGLVYRYDTDHVEDGVGGREGAFSMCTFWLVEAMTRAGVYEPKYLPRAVNIFENMLSFSNHLGMFSEEISRSGEQLGNTPQAFSHLALISAAFNLDRATDYKR
ncbi:hypothetical protein LZ554_008041 [Drepanopeziza brunnea f. sp. 'monogermtubi']|nr:hypothetical protein LZ554_008041 [Drepanopeziza brunnea f. sp. 'monogermtubi']